jgi:hypothetical protein
VKLSNQSVVRVFGGHHSAPRAGLGRGVGDRAHTIVLLFSLGFGCWLVSLPRIAPAEIDGFGLVGALPITYWLALLSTLAVFVLRFGKAAATPYYLVSVVLFIVYLHATPGLIYDGLRYPWVYKHLGLVEYIGVYGAVDPLIDAYHNWPGFFALWALLTETSGVPLETLAAWAQPLYNLLYLPPLLLLLRAFSQDDRVVWLGVWLFYLTNWVGQDYFAPQALAYFFYLTVLAFLLHLFPRCDNRLTQTLGSAAARLLQTTYRLPEPSERYTAQRAVLALSVVLLSFAAMVYSHQLTPFVTIVCVIALAAAGFARLRATALLFMALTALWLTFMATGYLAGHLSGLLADLGAIGQNVERNVGERLSGAPERQLVLSVQLGLSVALWLLAGAGLVRSWRRGRIDLALAALAFAPFPLLALQPYGGEALLRLYFFTQPAMCLLAASALLADGAPAFGARRRVALGAVLGLLLGGLVVAYYGNEAVNYVSATEAEVFRALYETVPEGSLLMAVSPNYPLLNSAFYYRVVNNSLVQQVLPEPFEAVFVSEGEVDVSALRAYMQGFPHAYLVFSEVQRLNLEVLRAVPPASVAALAEALATDPAFEVFHRVDDVVIYTLRRVP